MIYKIEDFMDENGRQVRRHTPMLVEGVVTGEKKVPMYVGTCMVTIHSPQGTRQTPMPFTIDADTLEQAFAKYEDSARSSIAGQEAEMKKRQLAASIGEMPPMLPPIVPQRSRRC